MLCSVGYAIMLHSFICFLLTPFLITEKVAPVSVINLKNVLPIITLNHIWFGISQYNILSSNVTTVVFHHLVQQVSAYTCQTTFIWVITLPKKIFF